MITEAQRQALQEAHSKALTAMRNSTLGLFDENSTAHSRSATKLIAEQEQQAFLRLTDELTQPEMVTTQAERDALPKESVIRESGDILVKYDDGRWYYEDRPVEVTNPAEVIWKP